MSDTSANAETEPEYDTEIVSHDDLTKHPDNYRTHPDDQIEHIRESLRDHGFYKNIVISEDDYILAGHGVTKATKAAEGTLSDEITLAEEEGEMERAKRLRLPNNGLIPAVRIPLPHDHPTALKRLTGDNELRRIGEQNDKKLIELLDKVEEDEDEDLLGTGYDDQRMNNLKMVNKPDDRLNEIDEEEHWSGMPEYGDEQQETYKLTISFRNRADRRDYIESAGELHPGLDPDEEGEEDKTTVSVWWPEKEENQRNNIKFEPEGKETEGEPVTPDGGEEDGTDAEPQDGEE